MITRWPNDTYVLVPSYKSAAPLRLFLSTLVEIVPKEFICVVDDASNDGTYEFCRDFGIDCVRHSVNKGKGAALRTGFSHIISTKGIDTDRVNARNDINPARPADVSTPNKGRKYSTPTDHPPVDTNINTVTPSHCNWILTMDADGQHSPADIQSFLDAAKRYPNLGICIGARDMRPGAMPLARIFSNRLTSLILSALTGICIKDSQCGYRLYSAALLKSVQIEYNRFQAESEIILKAKALRFLIRFEGVQTLYLKGGESHISHLIDTLRWAAAVLQVRVALTFEKNGRRRL